MLDGIKEAVKTVSTNPQKLEIFWLILLNLIISITVPIYRQEKSLSKFMRTSFLCSVSGVMASVLSYYSNLDIKYIIGITIVVTWAGETAMDFLSESIFNFFKMIAPKFMRRAFDIIEDKYFNTNNSKDEK